MPVDPLAEEVKRKRGVKKPKVRLLPGLPDARRRVEPDWREFFLQFLAEHGHANGWVQDEGRILFSDGWSCAADSYMGPYTAPPGRAEDVRGLKARFWKRRLALLRRDRDEALAELSSLLELQRAVPGDLLARGLAWWDEEAGVWRRTPSERVDWQTLKTKFDTLARLVKEAERTMMDLGEPV